MASFFSQSSFDHTALTYYIIIQHDLILLPNNGPPIPDSYRKQIFEPAFSIRQTGRGLGLHVARDLLAAYNCSLDLAQEGTLLSGPCFRIRFDGRRVIN
jgi:C4-dicarboxylate-specific signal transduction histidine kinase